LNQRRLSSKDINSGGFSSSTQYTTVLLLLMSSNKQRKILVRTTISNRDLAVSTIQSKCLSETDLQNKFVRDLHSLIQLSDSDMYNIQYHRSFIARKVEQLSSREITSYHLPE